MDFPADTDPQGYRQWLRDIALAELASARPRLRPPLRAMYEAEQAVPRTLEMRRVTVVSVGVYVVIVLLMNLLVVAHPNVVFVLLQITITPSLALLISSLFYRPDMRAIVRESAATVASSCFTLVTILAVAGSPIDSLVPNLFLATLPVMYVLFFVRLRFIAAVIFTAYAVACMAVVISVRHDLPPTLRYYPLGFMLAAAIPALFGTYRLEIAARRVYLHGVVQGLQIEELADQNARLGELSATDPVTGAANRRRFDATLTDICGGPAEGTYLLLIDLDHFKAFNDRHGHLAGDCCLREVVGAMRGQLSRYDLLARFGGEEFAILLAARTETQAHAMAERVRAAIAGHVFMVGDVATRVTISVGVAALVPGMSALDVIATADAALYEAKNAGRNRVRVAAAG